MPSSSGHDTGWFLLVLASVGFLAWSVQATCCLANEVLESFGEGDLQLWGVSASTGEDGTRSCVPLTIDG